MTALRAEKIWMTSPWAKANLTEKNHISQYILEGGNPILLYHDAGLWEGTGVCDNPKTSYDMHFIESWEQQVVPTESNEPVNLPEIQVYLKQGTGEVVAWEPVIEYALRKDFLMKNYHPQFKYCYGCIDGQISHLGPFAPGEHQAYDSKAAYAFSQKMRPIPTTTTVNA
jgi:hypothetical protein